MTTKQKMEHGFVFALVVISCGISNFWEGRYFSQEFNFTMVLIGTFYKRVWLRKGIRSVKLSGLETGLILWGLESTSPHTSNWAAMKAMMVSNGLSLVATGHVD